MAVALETPDRRAGVARRGLRLIVRSFKADPRNHAIAMAGATLYSLTLVQFTRTISWAADTTVIPALNGERVSRTDALVCAAVVIGILLLRGLGTSARRYFLAIAEFRTEELWRSDLFAHVIDQPLKVVRAHPAGRLIAHVDSDVNTAGTVIKPLAFAVGTVVLAITGLLSLFEIHLWFGLVGSVLFPTLALLNQRFSRIVEQPAADVQRTVANVTSVAHESFDGVIMVKTLGREDAEVERFRSKSESLNRRRQLLGRINTFYQPLLRLLPNVGAILMIVVGAAMIDRGSVSLGELIGAVTLLSIMALPLRVFAFFLQSLPPSVVALDRIDAFLAYDGRTDDAVDHAEEALEPPEVMRFDNVGLAYVSSSDPVPANADQDSEPPNNAVLDGLSFSVRQGEVVAVVGKTGAGKTTLAELASGLLEPSEGIVLKQGGLTVVPVLQEAFLFNDSVVSNITLGHEVSDEQLHLTAESAQAHKFISDLPTGYQTVIGERGVTLSGGQRQRVALVRALVRQPGLLVLDDATSAIDPVIESAILESLRDQRLTMLVVANRLSTISLADRVLFLQAGAIAAEGTHEELLQNADYRSLVAAEFDGTTP